MADFCSLCGYTDIDVEKLYEEHIKSTIKEHVPKLDEGEYYGGSVPGICEHCGLTGMAIDKNYDLWGVYLGKDSKIIGHINEENLELTIV